MHIDIIEVINIKLLPNFGTSIACKRYNAMVENNQFRSGQIMKQKFD